MKIVLTIILYLVIGEHIALLPVFIDKWPFIYEDWYGDTYDPVYVAICCIICVVIWPILISLVIVIKIFLYIEKPIVNIGKLIVKYRKTKS